MSLSISGIYYDATDPQNRIDIGDGIYAVDHEHLTERGTVAESNTPNTFVFTPASGDTAGLTPYHIQFASDSSPMVTLLRDDQPFLNSTGLFLRWDDEMGDPAAILLELQESAPQQDANEASPVEIAISVVSHSDDPAELEAALETIHGFATQFGGALFQSIAPRLRELAQHDNKKIAYRAKKASMMLGR